MIGESLYGSFLYGERVNREYITLILYDFGIQTYNLDNGLPITGISWELYRRDRSRPLIDPVDNTHILVDSSVSINELIGIDLDDYNIRDDEEDFYIRAWKDDNIKHLSEININYYPQRYVLSEINKPYLRHRMGLVRGGDVVGPTSGCIEIEPLRWQLVSIPVQFGYWDGTKHVNDGTTIARIKNYVIDQIGDVFGVQPETMVEVCNAYIGDNNQFYNFIVGVTNESSSHNFELVYDDGICKEFTAFWVKSINPTPFTITWGEL